jgi:hypothetical protein
MWNKNTLIELNYVLNKNQQIYGNAAEICEYKS